MHAQKSMLDHPLIVCMLAFASGCAESAGMDVAQ